MTRVDLSDYAILIIIANIGICAALAYLNSRVGEKNGAGITGMLAVIGAWIALGIVKLAGFEDATPETVITLSVGILILPLIYSAGSLRNWVLQQKIKRLQNKKESLESQLNNIENQICHKRKTIKLTQLLGACGEDVSCLEKYPELIVQRDLMITAEKLRRDIDELSNEILSGGNIN